MRRDQIAGFFEANYCREKAIVVAVGDFQAERLAEKLTASLKALRSISPPPPSFNEPPPMPQPGFLRIERDLQLTHLDVVFPSVPMCHRDFPALMALSIILGGGRVSRVFRELFERRRLVQTIGTTVPPLKLAGIFSISTTFEPGREDVVRDILKAELRRVRTEPVSEDELALARTKVEASAVFKNETVSGQSFTLGLLACMGDVEYEPRFLAALAALRPADLLESAQKYLGEESAIELCCGPKARTCDSEYPAREPVAPTARPVANLPDRGDFEVLQQDKVTKVRLPNEAIMLIREDHDLPIVSICAMVRAGSQMDPKGKHGLASLTQDMLHRATKWRTAEQLAYAAESLGAEFGGGCSMDVARIEAYGLSRDFHELVKLFAEVLTAPAFDKQELDSIREHVLTELRALEDDIENLSSRMISEALFGDHPYSVCPLGTLATLPTLTADDLAEFYARHYCGRNLVVAVVGNIGWEDAATSLAGALQGLPPGPESAASGPQFPVMAEAKHLKLKRPFASPSVNVGWRLPETVHPDYPALHALSVVLGGPFSSRLWKELRERRGLCYALGAEVVRGNDAGVFSVSAATAKRHIVEVRDIIFDHIAEARAKACSEAEIEVARRYIIGAHELAHQGPSAWADLLASFEASGLGWDYDFRYPEMIARLTPDDIRRAAGRYLPLDRYVLLTISPQGLLARLLDRLFSLAGRRTT
jgi:zinc protease